MAPRLGYIIRINATIALWLRGGITYFTASSEFRNTTSGNGRRVSVSGLALNLEPQVVMTPVPHFGLTLGPVADIPLSGTVESRLVGSSNAGAERTNMITNFGLVFGLAGWI